MKRFNIEGFSKYSFGLDGSVYHIRKSKFLNGSISKKGYLQFCLHNDDNIYKTLGQQNIVYKLLNTDYQLFQGNKMVIGHLNSNTLDNHISNLQLMTQRENLSIERTQKSKLPVGVYFNKKYGKYQTQIYKNNKVHYIGLYLTPEEASAAYQNKLKTLLYG